MITYLIFKRQETFEGATKVVTKVVPVEISQINSGEGWVLSGHTDIIDVVALPEPLMPCSSSVDTKQLRVNDSNEADADKIIKFVSNVSGTAKLVRSKGVIRIVARRGKTTYNQTTPNSVCINDFTKNEFFKNCREYHGPGSGIFEFTLKHGNPYDYWNTVIDKEYQRQKCRHKYR